MYRLYLFLFKYRVALIFIILESISFWLVVQNNRYQSAAFFNSSNAVAANLLSISSEIRSYFILKKTNARLAEEVSQLRKQLEKRKIAPVEGSSRDSTFIPYEFITAKVISNSIHNFNNYLTINVGSEDGIEPDMGVIGANGIVGKVKYTSSNFSVITSLLHSNFLISSKVENKINLCSTQWSGIDPRKARLLYVPKHIVLQKGDTISTSGFNSIFPEDILIGTVSEINLNEGAPFYDIEILLTTEFANLAYVQVIKSNDRVELDSLDNVITNF